MVYPHVPIKNPPTTVKDKANEKFRLAYIKGTPAEKKASKQ